MPRIHVKLRVCVLFVCFFFVLFITVKDLLSHVDVAILISALVDG